MVCSTDSADCSPSLRISILAAPLHTSPQPVGTCVYLQITFGWCSDITHTPFTFDYDRRSSSHVTKRSKAWMLVLQQGQHGTPWYTREIGHLECYCSRQVYQ